MLYIKCAVYSSLMFPNLSVMCFRFFMLRECRVVGNVILEAGVFVVSNLFQINQLEELAFILMTLSLSFSLYHV